jgi:hypothetical protein
VKEKTKELADSVGAVYPVLFMGRHDGVLFTETELETFVALVAAAEREECAKLCDDKAKETIIYHGQVWSDYFARAIRARRNT